MIKLNRSEKPKELTDALVKELTEEFKNDKEKSVWNKKFIRDALLEMSRQKCCYCETRLEIKNDYLTVDHFHNKDDYPEEVVEWDNLLPCCNMCNSSKKDFDTVNNPFINPTKDHPKKYLYFENYRYKSINQNKFGLNTIEKLNLNDSDNVIYPRFEVGQLIYDYISDINDLMEIFESNELNKSDDNIKGKIVRKVRKTLKCTLPNKEYSALAATIIVESDDFAKAKNKMIEYGLWHDELTELENNAKNICLSLKI